jgi:hypothetical protein
MKFPMHFPQPVSRDVRVNFRGADARVAEQFLNHPQIRPVLKQTHVQREFENALGGRLSLLAEVSYRLR